MSYPSLQSKINRQAFFTIFAVGAATISSALAFSYLKARVSRNTVVESLEKSTSSEVDSLLPTFLLPEEQAGQSLLLDRFKKNDELDAVAIIHSQNELPSDYKKCALSNQTAICISADHTRVAVLTPIIDGDQHFGYLLKSKEIPSFWSKDQTTFVVFAITIAFGLIAIFLFIGITQVTSKEVPHSLNALVAWLDDWISNESSRERPNFRFKEFQDLAERIATVVDERQREKEQARVFALASQVAHDIRSPLAALAIIEQDLGALDEEKRLIVRSSVNRMRDIANNLLVQNRAVLKNERAGTDLPFKSELISTQLLSNLIEPVITEKRLEIRSQIGIEIDASEGASSYGIFANVNPTEFKRMISNLLNNAVEALNDTGVVTVSVYSYNQVVEIVVYDNGKGIPSEILGRLGQRGETYGKAGGSGLGLYHAKISLEAWGGSLKIDSELGTGTSVILSLPRAQAPEWFVSTLMLSPHAPLVILDDDNSIHQIWQRRIESVRGNENGIHLVHLSTPEQFREWIKSHPQESRTALYLCDQELLGYADTGLSLISEFNLGTQSILVTSRYEETNIAELCQNLRVRVIPKAMAGFVPIKIAKTS